MAGSLNKVMLIGNLGSDPEIRYTPSGRAVANFNIATSENWTDQSGQRQEKTEWHKIVVWGKLAELCGEYLAKGRQIYLEGRVQTRQWEDRDGNKRYTTEVQARDITFLGSRGESAGTGQNYGQQASGQNGGSQDRAPAGGGNNGSNGSYGDHDYGPPPITDDDIPF